MLDGYSAPLTAGNFAAEVLNGSLNNRRLDASYTSVLAQAAQQGADVGKLLLQYGICVPPQRSCAA